MSRHVSVPLLTVVLALALVVGTVVGLLVRHLDGSPKPGAHLIPVAVTGKRLPPVGGAYPLDGHFARTLKAHSWCGGATGLRWINVRGYHQRFQHCRMDEASVTVRPLTTPLPTPRPQSTPTPIVRVSDRQTCDAGGNCGPYEVALINAERASHGIPPLAYDPVDSAGGNCPGAIGHSRAMAATGTIWHTNASYPNESFPQNLCGSYSNAAQNVALTPGSPASAIDYAMQLYLSEPWAPGCAGSHHCSIDSTVYTRVGIGTVMQGGYLYDTQDFFG